MTEILVELNENIATGTPLLSIKHCEHEVVMKGKIDKLTLNIQTISKFSPTKITPNIIYTERIKLKHSAGIVGRALIGGISLIWHYVLI